MIHTIIHNMPHLVGAGHEGVEVNTQKNIIMCTSIPQLLETCLQPSPTQWQSIPIPNVPNYWSTAASLGGYLLVVRGVKDHVLAYKTQVSGLLGACLLSTSLHLFLDSCW